jgi:hypothetical protein
MTFGTSPQETKSGSYMYSGRRSACHEWVLKFLTQKIRKKVSEHKSKSASASPDRGRAERSPVVGQGDDGPRSTAAAWRRTERSWKPDQQEEEERSDCVSRRAAQWRMNSCQERLFP